MTFDLDLWPTDLNINRDPLLAKDYLPTKFEASGAKRSWVISCRRWSKLAWPLTLTFDLRTWISIGVMYSPRTIYLPSLKLLGQSVREVSVAQGVYVETFFNNWISKLTDMYFYLLVMSCIYFVYDKLWKYDTSMFICLACLCMIRLLQYKLCY